MVDTQKRSEAGGKDPVQNVGVPSVQRKGDEAFQDAGRSWVLNIRALRAHHAHLSSRPGRINAHCGFCRQGVAAVVVLSKESSATDSVAESDGDDTKGGPTPPRGDGKPGWRSGAVRKAAAHLAAEMAGGYL